MRHWIEPPEITPPAELLDAASGLLLPAQVLCRRGITTTAAARAFLDPGQYSPAPAIELPGMDAAATRVMQAVQTGEPVCVWGDFDVDGQTSTTVLVSTLRDLGAKVSFHIPVRERESHGVNRTGLQKVIDEGARLVLTCDTGITAHEAVTYAQERGVDVVITDHHELPPELPRAVAVVNPHLLASPDHPLSSLPGVGVAYKLAEELYRRAGQPEKAETLLDLAALGIIVDLAILRGEARCLVQRGLEVIRQQKRLGLKVMMEMAELNPASVTEEHIGFILGPRLNALGRLADANPAVELLTTRDLARARVLAAQLEALNARRKLLTDQVFQGALAQIERDPSLLEEAALVLSHPAWPAGVIGIVASRLVERFHRPVVLLSAPPGEMARGSARSVEGCNITGLIAQQADLLVNFGGHAMAAGLSLDPALLPDFRKRLCKAVRADLGDVEAELRLEIDGFVQLPELTLELVQGLERLAPFGPGNPALTLACRNVEIKSTAPMGRNAEHLQLIVEDSQGSSQRVIWWQGAGWSLPQGRVDLAFSARASSYRGATEVQIVFVDARAREDIAAGKMAAPGEINARPLLVVEDYRQDAMPAMILRDQLGLGPVQVWAEGDSRQRLNSLATPLHSRLELEPCPVLAIWTTPPGPGELQAALQAARPEKILLFGVDPGLETPESFLKLLAGLTKYAIHQQGGHTSLGELAAALAQRESTVQAGLAWLASRGVVSILSEEKGHISLAAGGEGKTGGLERLTAKLKGQMEETAAYRRYFRVAETPVVRVD